MKIQVINERLAFWREVYDKYKAAYIALSENNVKFYVIDDRQLTRYDIDVIEEMLEKAEEKVDEYEAVLEGKAPRKAFGVIPMNW